MHCYDSTVRLNARIDELGHRCSVCFDHFPKCKRPSSIEHPIDLCVDNWNLLKSIKTQFSLHENALVKSV